MRSENSIANKEENPANNPNRKNNYLSFLSTAIKNFTKIEKVISQQCS